MSEKLYAWYVLIQKIFKVFNSNVHIIANLVHCTFVEIVTINWTIYGHHFGNKIMYRIRNKILS